MKIRFGINFEFKTARRMPPQVHAGSAESATERLPEDAEVDYEDRVAPLSRPVLGFKPNPHPPAREGPHA